MNKTMILAVLAAALAMPLVHATPAGTCDSEGSPALGVVPIQTAAATFYIDDRNALLGNGLWLYQETNGLAGLQRGSSSALVPDDADSCVDPEGADRGPDTLLF